MLVSRIRAESRLEVRDQRRGAGVEREAGLEVLGRLSPGERCSRRRGRLAEDSAEEGGGEWRSRHGRTCNRSRPSHGVARNGNAAGSAMSLVLTLSPAPAVM